PGTLGARLATHRRYRDIERNPADLGTSRAADRPLPNPGSRATGRLHAGPAQLTHRKRAASRLARRPSTYGPVAPHLVCGVDRACKRRTPAAAASCGATEASAQGTYLAALRNVIPTHRSRGQ